MVVQKFVHYKGVAIVVYKETLFSKTGHVAGGVESVVFINGHNVTEEVTALRTDADEDMTQEDFFIHHAKGLVDKQLAKQQ